MCGTHDNYVSRQVVSALLWYKYWMTISHTTCYSISPVIMFRLVHYGGNRSARSCWESGGCQDELREEMFCICLRRDSPQISIAHLCQPNAASKNYTASWNDTGWPWAAHSMTLYWWRTASLLLCTFFLSSNTLCMLIFGVYICIFHKWMKIFVIIFSRDLLCLKICDPCGLPL